MTKSEAKRIDAFRSLGCICCAIHGWFNSSYDVHHIVDAGYRRLSGGHAATLPICPWHHRGFVPDGWTQVRMRHSFGPSLALCKREFIATYGDERQLLQMVNERLEYLNASTITPGAITT